MALSEFARALVYAVDEWLNYPEVQDAHFLNAPTLKAFKALNMVGREPAGRKLLETIRIGRSKSQIVTDPTSSTYMDLTTSGATGDSVANFLSNAKYDWHMRYGRLIIPDADLNQLANEKDRARNYMDKNLKGFIASIGVDVEEALWSWNASSNKIVVNSTDNPWGDSTHSPSLPYWIDAPAVYGVDTRYAYASAAGDQTSAGTWKPPGDIDRGVSTNPWWNAIHYKPSTATALSVQNLTEVIIRQGALGVPRADLILVSPRVYSFLLGVLMSAQRWVDVKNNADANLGFDAIHLQNAMVVAVDKLGYHSTYGSTGVGDGTQANAVDNVIFYINSQTLKLLFSDRTDAERVVLPHPVQFWKTTSYVALVTDCMQSQGRFSNWYIA